MITSPNAQLCFNRSGESRHPEPPRVYRLPLAAEGAIIYRPTQPSITVRKIGPKFMCRFGIYLLLSWRSSVQFNVLQGEGKELLGCVSELTNRWVEADHTLRRNTHVDVVESLVMNEFILIFNEFVSSLRTRNLLFGLSIFQDHALTYTKCLGISRYCIPLKHISVLKLKLLISTILKNSEKYFFRWLQLRMAFFV